jgi:hypothetical protein
MGTEATTTNNLAASSKDTPVAFSTFVQDYSHMRCVLRILNDYILEEGVLAAYISRNIISTLVGEGNSDARNLLASGRVILSDSSRAPSSSATTNLYSKYLAPNYCVPQATDSKHYPLPHCSHALISHRFRY